MAKKRAECEFSALFFRSTIKKNLEEGLKKSPKNKLIRKLLDQISAIEECKKRGNESFKSKKYPEAIEFYSYGLKTCKYFKSLHAILYSNRGNGIFEPLIFSEVEAGEKSGCDS